MITKKFSKLLLIGLLAATMAGSALAQDGGRGNGGNGGRGPGGRGGMGGGRGPGAMVEIVQRVAEETELTASQVTQDLLDGQTVAEILTANGDDPEAFVQSILTDAKTRLDEQVTAGTITQEQADERLTTREAELRDFVFEGNIPMGRGDGPLGQGARAVIQLERIIVEQAELEMQTVLQSLRDGKSLETQITEAGKDVADVKAASIEAATLAINEAVTAGTITQERADQVISNLEAAVDRLLSADLKLLPDNMGGQGGMAQGGGLPAAVAEATGLTVEEVRAEITAGKTLADVLTSKDISVDTFVEDRLAQEKTHLDERVASGDISQAIADARLELARVELTERLNGAFELKGPLGRDGGPMTPPDAPMTTPEATAESQA